MRLALALVAAIAGCNGDPAPPSACDDAPTWDGFAEGYVQTWCAPCHSSLLVGPERQGAPDGVDFDRWSEVHALADRVQARAVDYDSTPMPPQGGIPEDDVARLGQWLACGARGEDPPPGPCDTLTVGPATTVASQADADALCRSYDAVDALTVSGDAVVDCLCAVTGDLTQTGGALDLPLLGSVGGALRAGGPALRAPALASVGADLAGDGPLAELSVPALTHVGGNLDLTGLPSLATIDLGSLYDVGGELVISSDPVLPTVALPRLRTVGGDLRLEALDGLTTLTDTRALLSVGGSVVLRELPQLAVVDPWSFLLLGSVGGDLVVSGNDRLAAIHGFTSLGESVVDDGLPTFAGSVAIEDNRSLMVISGFDQLYHVGGDLRLRASALGAVPGFVNLVRVDGSLVLEDLPDLEALTGFEDLESVGELRLARVNERVMADFPSLASVDRDLTIDACPHLMGIAGFPALTLVGEDFALTDNPVLATLDGLQALGVVGGDLAVTGNAALPSAAVGDWVDGISVGGAVTVQDNGL